MLPLPEMTTKKQPSQPDYYAICSTGVQSLVGGRGSLITSRVPRHTKASARRPASQSLSWQAQPPTHHHPLGLLRDYNMSTLTYARSHNKTTHHLTRCNPMWVAVGPSSRRGGTQQHTGACTSSVVSSPGSTSKQLQSHTSPPPPGMLL